MYLVIDMYYYSSSWLCLVIYIERGINTFLVTYVDIFYFELEADEVYGSKEVSQSDV